MTIILALTFLIATAGASLSTAQRDVVRRLEERLLAPCCYSQAVGEHLSAEAAQMRQEIEERVASGENESAIMAHYKAQYGERILVVPDGKTGNLLFTLPWVAFLAFSAVFLAVIRRMARAGARSNPPANQEEVDRWRGKYGEAVEREIRNWV